jgi:CHAD domain-containing protein
MANPNFSGDSQKKQRSGLAHFMVKVLKDVKRAETDFEEEPVHDLRTALRRCRTMGKGLAAYDPEKSFHKMGKSSAKVFHRLGELRDFQVIMDWVEKIAPANDALKAEVKEALGKKEAVAKYQAGQALKKFDRQEWRKLTRILPKEMRRIPLGGLVFQHLALRRWEEAKEAHRKAMRNPSSKNLHEARIALKHFRYVVENFLPKRSDKWGADLKRVQDLLGGVHDLDVLRDEVEAVAKKSSATGISGWRTAIEQERAKRLSEYESKMKGRTSLFNEWREDLPKGEELDHAAMETLRCWASFRDPDIKHSKHVARLAVRLWDGLNATGIYGGIGHSEMSAPVHFSHGDVDEADHEQARKRPRRILEAAAMLHEVGKSKKDAGHHKKAYRMIKKLEPPIGWTKGDMLWTALTARYHRGAEPQQEQRGFASLEPGEQNAVRWISGTLRLADALDAGHDGRVINVFVEKSGRVITIRAEGYQHDAESAGALGEKKHLLESLCGCPIIVQPARAALKVMAAAAS